VAPENDSRSGASSGEHEESGALGLTGKLLAGRYRVESRLGAGGMASVYRARDEKLQRTVVVKVPHAALLVDAGFRKRFGAEVLNLAQLGHPHIIRIHDVGEDDGVPFAVVEFLRGGDLSDRIRTSGGRLSPAQCMEWLPRIAETLDFVRERGIVHRDVSPGNIIFDDHGYANLSDFGIATAISRDDPDATLQEYSNLTRAGGFVGNATYAPPESIERRLNPGYDQYSLGVVVYEALSGQLPFPRASPEAMLVAKNTQRPTPLDQHVPGLPTGVVAAVMRAISKDPGQRFESAQAFVSAFEAAIPAAAKTQVVQDAVTPKTEVVSAAELRSLSQPSRLPRVAFTVAVLAGVTFALVFAVPWKRLLSGGDPAKRPAPAIGAVEFSAGSTPAEREQALELCRQTLGKGCTADDYADETPRTVAIGRIRFDTHEVTNREFAAFVSETRHRTQAERAGFSWDPLAKGTDLSWRAPTRGTAYGDRLDHPVVHVSLSDAVAYCRAQGKRLPSEDEWEYGARGSERSTFPWGESWSPDRAVWRTDGTRPVGSIPDGATPGGLQDMAGNVWEWTSTETARQTAIVKGGSWFEHDGALLRGATRMEVEGGEWTSADLGFRCVEDGD
jgi:formylglycine-generating enzyme required for sulfatase activity